MATAALAVALTMQGGAPASARSVLAPGDFATTWNTTLVTFDSSASNQVHLPLVSDGTYNFTVNWGDGSSSTIAAWNAPAATHTYTASGSYPIVISGTLQGWRFDGSGDRLKLTGVSQWGDLNFGSGGGYFRGAENMTCSATDAPDLTGVTDLSSTFLDAKLFNCDLSSWDTSGVTDMSSMFQGATAFNQAIGTWDTSQVTDMSAMFAYAESFNRPIGGWQTPNLRNTGYLFTGAKAFNQPIGSWDTSQVTTMQGMFSGASVFNQDIGAWNTGHVTEMSYMFGGALAFNQPIGNWNTGNVTAMAMMFNGAKVFNQPIGNWNTSQVTTMMSMFSTAKAFNQPIGNWNTSQVTTMMFMFFGATAFDQDLGSWNVSQVGDLGSAFNDSGLSTSHYDGILNGWAGLPSVQSGVALGAAPTMYSQNAAASRQELIDGHGWTITDGGLSPFWANPAGVQFGTQDVDVPSTPQTVTVTNVGAGTLSFPSQNAVQLSGPNSDQFSIQQNTCAGASLRQSGTCTVQVGFRPTSPGAKTAALIFADDSPDTPQHVDLTGTGVEVPVVVGFLSMPGSLPFGNQTAGTASAPQSVTIQNNGTADLVIAPGGVGLTGADAGQFTVTGGNCAGVTVPAGGTCTAQVAFAPTSAGSKSATLQFTANLPAAQTQVPVTGTGVAAPAPDPSPQPSPPAKPSGVKATAKGGAVKASWKPVTGATSYTVTVTGKSVKKRKVTKKKTVSGTTVKVKVKLKKRSKFTACVRATNSAGTSAAACKKGRVK